MTHSDATPDVMSDSDDLAALDSVLRGGADADSQDLSAFVDDLVAVYVRTDDLEQSPALRQFTSASTAPATAPPARRRWSKAAAAVIGTVAGKVVLGSAVAVAAVGGLHASDTVDVPFLPDTDRQSDHVPDRPASESTPTDSVPDVSSPASSSPTSNGAGASNSSTGDVEPENQAPQPNAPTTPADALIPDVTIPGPTTPSTTVPDVTPPILDRDVLSPGPTVPDTPG